VVILRGGVRGDADAFGERRLPGILGILGLVRRGEQGKPAEYGRLTYARLW